MPGENADEVRSETVKIKNPGRQSLMIRIPGRSIRLGPGDSAEIPKAFLETPELKALGQQGMLVELPAPVKKASSGENTAEEQEDDGPQGRRPRRR